MIRRVAALLLVAAVAAAPARADEAAKEQAARVRKARVEATDILRTLGGPISAERRSELVARFDALDARARVPALVEGLAPARRPGTQRFAIERLRALGAPEIALHLAHLSATPSVTREVRDDADAGARALHADYARRWYERIVLNDLGGRRTLALGRLADIASPDSVPVLAKVVATVGLEVRAQVAALESMATVPVNLGAAGNAAAQVPIQLPTISLITVHVNAQVPAATQATWKETSLRGLRAIAGDLGEVPDAYLSWYRERTQRRPRP